MREVLPRLRIEGLAIGNSPIGPSRFFSHHHHNCHHERKAALDNGQITVTLFSRLFYIASRLSYLGSPLCSNTFHYKIWLPIMI
jgi:hypothetical protein